MVVGALAQSASAGLARLYVQRSGGLPWPPLAAAGFRGRARSRRRAPGGGPGAHELLATLYRADYGNKAKVLTWVMVAAGLGYVARFLIVATSTRTLVPGAGAAVRVRARWWWERIEALGSPRAGLVGAAWALSCGGGGNAGGSRLILGYTLRRAPEAESEREAAASRLGVVDGG